MAQQTVTVASVAPSVVVGVADASTQELVTQVGSPLASVAETLLGASTTEAVTPAGLVASRPYIDVHSHGAVGDGSTDDTAALAAAFASAVATQQAGGALTLDRMPAVNLHVGKRYEVSTLDIPAGVRLVCNGAELIASATGTMVTMDGHYAEIHDALFRGLGAGSDLIGITVPSTSTWTRIAGCRFNSFGNSAIRVEGNVCRIENCFAQNCVLDDAVLASPRGVLHIEGSSANDQWVSNCEFTASNTAISGSGNAYAVVMLGKASTFEGVVAEISDHGFYINGSHNKFIGCRADLNRGHGWVFAGGDGEVVGCSSLSNGRDATNTYDGYLVTAGAYRFSSCSANVLATLTAVQHRYGFNSTATTTTGSQFDASCSSDQHATAAIAVAATGGRVIPTMGPFINTSGTGTTWDVQTYRWPHTSWNLAAGSARNLDTITNGVSGQRLTLRGDGNTTLVHTSATANKLVLLGGVDLLAAANTFYEFVNAVGVWYQVL